MALQKFLEAILGVKIGSGSLITPSDSYFFKQKYINYCISKDYRLFLSNKKVSLHRFNMTAFCTIRTIPD